MNNIFNRFVRFAALLFCFFALPSCQKEEVQEVYLSLGSEQLLVTKNGFSYNGEQAVISVVSNTYWVISYDQSETWITPDMMAGNGDREVLLNIKESDREGSRDITFTFKTQGGFSETVKIIQAGNGEVITYLSEGIGSGADLVSVNQFDGWEKEGTGSLRTQYSGTETYVDGKSPSSGYESASGGNNILFGSEGSMLQFGGVAIKGNNSFTLSFGSMTGAGAFDTDALQVFISKDLSNWTPVPYTRGAGSGWEVSMVPFVLSQSGLDQVYFRFVSSSGDDYRIDDIALEEGGGYGMTITFVEDMINVVDYLIFEETFDWVDGQAGDYENDKFGGNDNGAVTPQNGWAMSSIWKRWKMIKGGTAAAPGKVTTRKLEELTGPSTLLQTFDIAAAFTSDYKSMQVEILNAGTISVDDGLGVKSLVFSVDKTQEWYTKSFVIDNATAATQIAIGSALGAGEIAAIGSNRFILDNVRIYNRVQENPTAPLELSLDPGTLSFGQDSDEQMVRMLINKEWTAVPSDTWLNVSPASGTFGTVDMKVSVGPNDTGNVLSGSVLIYVDGEEVGAVPVEQSNIPDVVELPQPTGLKVVDATTTQLTFEWDNIPDVPRQFKIEISGTAEGDALHSFDFNVKGSEDANKRWSDNRFTMTRLQAGTPYVLRVKTVNDDPKMVDSPWTTLNVRTESEPALDQDVILFHNFDGCEWGGDNIYPSWGYRPTGVNKDTPPTAPMDSFAAPETGGSSNMGDFVSPAYKEMRRITGWAATRIYEFPGCIKFGTGSDGGFITTAPLSNIVGTTDLEVSFKMATWSSINVNQVVTTDTFLMTVTAEGGGTVVGNNQFTMTEKYQWKDGFKVTVTGATAATKLKFTTSKVTGGTSGARCFMDDLLVRRVDATEVTLSSDSATLPEAGVPAAGVNVTSNADWTASSEDKWLTFTASGTPGTTAMSISANANDSSGDRTGTIAISAGGKVRRTISVTQAAGSSATKVGMPTDLRLLGVTTTNVAFGWNDVPGNDRHYRIDVATTPEGPTLVLNGQEALFEPNISTFALARYPQSRFTMSRLNPDTEYYIRIQTISSQIGLADSDVAVLKVRTARQPVLPTNTVLFHNFDGCMWAGDGVLQTFGFCPLASGDQSGFNENTPFTTLRGSEDGGSSNVAGTGATALGEPYRASRRITGWTSTGIYEFPGYLKFGTGSAGGTLTTAALSGINGNDATIEVSFKLAAWVQTTNTGTKTTDTFKMKVTVVGPGTIAGNNEFTVTERYTWKDGFKVTVTGTSPETKIRFQTEKVDGGTNGARCFIDDILVVQK